jgi:hypothetical protein
LTRNRAEALALDQTQENFVKATLAAVELTEPIACVADRGAGVRQENI